MTKALRHQHFNLTAQEFIAVVTKKLLHLRIDQHDFTFAAHHHDGIGRSFEQLPESILRLFAAGNVGVNFKYAESVPPFVPLENLSAGNHDARSVASDLVQFA